MSQPKDMIFHVMKNLDVHVIYNHNHQLVITGSREQIQSAIQFISKLPLSQVYYIPTFPALFFSPFYI
jgi:hypothetical protein